MSRHYQNLADSQLHPVYRACVPHQFTFPHTKHLPPYLLQAKSFMFACDHSSNANKTLLPRLRYYL